MVGFDFLWTTNVAFTFLLATFVFTNVASTVLLAIFLCITNVAFACTFVIEPLRCQVARLMASQFVSDIGRPEVPCCTLPLI